MAADSGLLPNATVPTAEAASARVAPLIAVPAKESGLPIKGGDGPTTTEVAMANPVVPPVQQQLRSSLSSSMRLHVRQAAQAQILLGYALKKALRASDVLRALPANSTNKVVTQSKQTHEDQYNSAILERDDLLDRYIAEVEWLADHDATVVDEAIKSEYENFTAPAIEKGDAEKNEQASVAIKLLASHVRDQRQQHLTRAAVTADAGAIRIGGSK
jgi:hypothetical protein